MTCAATDPCVQLVQAVAGSPKGRLALGDRATMRLLDDGGRQRMLGVGEARGRAVHLQPGSMGGPAEWQAFDARHTD